MEEKEELSVSRCSLTAWIGDQRSDHLLTTCLDLNSFPVFNCHQVADKPTEAVRNLTNKVVCSQSSVTSPASCSSSDWI